MYYLYRHIRPDKNEPFYVGRGKHYSDGTIYRRAKSLKGRNNIWHSIVAKNNGIYEIDIIIDHVSYDEILKKEIEFINLYGKIIDHTGILCNLTDGGDGSIGLKHSEETKQKISTEKRNNLFYAEWLKSDEFKKLRIKSLKEIGFRGSLYGGHHKESSIQKMKELRRGGKNINAKRVINIVTGKIYSFVGEAAIEEGISRETLFKYLNPNNKRHNPTNLRYYGKL